MKSVAVINVRKICNFHFLPSSPQTKLTFSKQNFVSNTNVDVGSRDSSVSAVARLDEERNGVEFTEETDISPCSVGSSFHGGKTDGP
jgi:hypothetical protein